MWRYILAFSLVLTGSAGADDRVAVVLEDPKLTLADAAKLGEISRDFVPLRQDYPIAIGRTIVLGFCRADETAEAVKYLSLVHPKIGTRTDLALPTGSSGLQKKCPDASLLSIAALKTVQVGKQTLTVVAIVIAAPRSPAYVREPRVTYHAFLREGTTLLRHWNPGTNDFLGSEQPRLSAVGTVIEVVQPCQLQSIAGQIKTARTHSVLSIARGKLEIVAMPIDVGCTPASRA